MNMILSADLNWGIGCENKLLFHIKADMRYFKAKTINNTVIMGYNTFQSLPNQQPLVDRRNIVLTRKNIEINGVEIANSVENALNLVKGENLENVFIIGGEKIYQEFLPLANKIYVTKIYKTSAADTHFVNLDEHKDWQKTELGEIQSENDIEFSFDIYTKRC